MVERTEEAVLAAVRKIFPNATMGTEDGTDMLVINTNCQYTGWHGEFIIGDMNIEEEE